MMWLSISLNSLLVGAKKVRSMAEKLEQDPETTPRQTFNTISQFSHLINFPLHRRAHRMAA